MSPAPGGALGALEASGLGQAMRQWLWLYPAVETVHIVGIGLLFGSIAVLDLRLLGFSQEHSGEAARAPRAALDRGSFLLIVPSGLLMFTAHATEFIDSAVFVLKMCLILAGGAERGAVPHHHVPHRRRVGLGGDAQAAAAAVGAPRRRRCRC